MKAQTVPKFEPNDPVQTVEHLRDLNRIFDDEVEGVIWKRQAPLSVLSALKALPSHDVVDGRFYTPVEQVRNCIIDLFDEWNWRTGDAQQWLADDVEALARQMAEILSVSHLCLRVELVRDDACRKFHRDSVKARLICTYSGPGTELGITDGGNRTRHIETVPTSYPILLKGKLWRGSGQRSVVHRSPPIEGTAASRLVVVLDGALTDAQKSMFLNYVPKTDAI